jgi:hypothetical protein
MQDKGKTPSTGNAKIPEKKTDPPSKEIEESIDESIGYSEDFESPSRKEEKS